MNSKVELPFTRYRGIVKIQTTNGNLFLRFWIRPSTFSSDISHSGPVYAYAHSSCAQWQEISTYFSSEKGHSASLHKDKRGR